MILAACISVAVFLSVYGSAEKQRIADAQKAVSVHEDLLRGAANDLRENQDALKAARTALEAIRKAKGN